MTKKKKKLMMMKRTRGAEGVGGYDDDDDSGDYYFKFIPLIIVFRCELKNEYTVVPRYTSALE
jgi:hypothetical protein